MLHPKPNKRAAPLPSSSPPPPPAPSRFRISFNWQLLSNFLRYNALWQHFLIVYAKSFPTKKFQSNIFGNGPKMDFKNVIFPNMPVPIINYIQRASRINFWIQSTIFGSTKKSTFPKTFLPIFDVFFTSVFTPLSKKYPRNLYPRKL